MVAVFGAGEVFARGGKGGTAFVEAVGVVDAFAAGLFWGRSEWLVDESTDLVRG